MNRLIMATRFVKHNMPLGSSHDAPQLSDDEAYDVAAFMLSKPRPIKANLEADFPARWNKPVDSAFPPYLLGASADQHRFGPYPPLVAKQKEMMEQLKAGAAAERAAAGKSAPECLRRMGGCPWGARWAHRSTGLRRPALAAPPDGWMGQGGWGLGFSLFSVLGR